MKPVGNWESAEEIREYYQKQSEDFRRRWLEKQHKEQQEKYEKIMKRCAENEEEHRQQEIDYIKQQEARWARGELSGPFSQQYLDGQISAARWVLAIGIIMTALFKGQWALWILFIIIYKVYVKNIKEEALEADKKRWYNEQKWAKNRRW